MIEPASVVTADGVRLHVDRHRPEGEAWGSVLVLHAMMVDRRSMDRPAGQGLASHLARRGLEVWNADYRGHGKSGSNGPWTYDELVRYDLPALCAAVRQAGPAPVWVLGLSLGGHTSMAAQGEGVVHFDGAVLLSANVWVRSYEPSLLRKVRKTASMAMVRGLTAAFGRFPSRRVRMGPADEAKPYMDDLTRFWFSDRWQSRDGVDWDAHLSHIDIPVLSVIGRGDRLMAHPDGARNWVSRIGGHVFALVGRGELGLEHDPDHIGLGADPRCAPVWDWVVDWMRGRSRG